MAAAISPRCRASFPSLPIRSRVSARSRWTTFAPGGRGIAVRKVNTRGLAVPHQLGHVPGYRQTRVGIRLEALPCVLDGRLQQPLQREGAEQLVDATHPGRNPRHAHRAVSYRVGAIFDLVYPVALHRLTDDAEHVGRGGPGRAMTVIDGYAATLPCHVDDHLTVTGHGGVPRLDHVEAEAGGDRGVHRIPAAPEDVDSDFGGNRVRGRDGPMLNDDLILVRPPDAPCVYHLHKRSG